MNVHTKISTGTHDVWTDATKRHAAELWNGGATAKQIAEKLGVSRSVIVGLAHRNKDTFKPKMDGQPRTKPRNIHKARMEAVKREAGEFKAGTSPLLKIHVSDAERLAAGMGKELHELGKNECKFGLNHGGPFLFCADATDGGTYCPHHAMRAYRPKETR